MQILDIVLVNILLLMHVGLLVGIDIGMGHHNFDKNFTLYLQ